MGARAGGTPLSTITVRSPARLEGEIHLPGDKSVSHRALLLNALAAGTARVSGLSPGADVASTASCLRALGVEVGEGAVHGRGMRGLSPARAPLDCGNSGTTMRLLGAILAAQEFESILVGDASLSRRPMGRIAEPLRRMGLSCDPGPPLRVGGTAPARPIDHSMSVPSAQVKSAVLLAGLYAEGPTVVHEPAPTRNHTELMLAAMGARVLVEGGGVTVYGTSRLTPLDVEVPGDLSAAAFWLVAGGLHPSARLRIAGVGVNPTRSAIIEVLRRAGFRITAARQRVRGAEAVADLEVTTASAGQAGLELSGALAAALIDELPVLAVAAALLPGITTIRDAAELRVKESDRISAISEGLTAMGASVVAHDDGMTITGGGGLEGARVRSHGDHRVAMALAVGGMLARGETVIEGAGCVDISDPGFWAQADRLGCVA